MPENPIYDFLKANKLTDKDEATFLKEYSDSTKAKELYGFFQANNLTDKDFNVFYDTYLKKKGSVSPLGGKVGSSVGRLDVGAGITEIDDKGKPVGGALSRVSGITTPEQAKISRVNKAFGKIESFAGSREDFEEIYKQSPQEFDNLAKQVAPNVNKGEIDKFYTTEAARKDAYVDRVLQSYNQQKTKAQLESARRYRPVIESQFSTATIPLSNYTGKQYQLPQSEAQVSEILSDLNNEKEKLKTELTTNWNLSEVQTKAKELSEIEAAIRQNLTYQVGRMALERLSQNNPNVTSKDIGKEIFRVLHPDEYDLYEKVGGDKPVSFTVGTQIDTPVEADDLNEQMVQLGNEIKRMYGNETAIQDADIEEQTAKRKYTFQRQAQVKQKIAAILHERGLSPDKATEELKDKVVNKYLPDEDKEIWYNNNKIYNDVDLPSTGFAYSLKNAYYDTVKDAVGTVFGGLMPNRKKMRAAELLEGMSTSDVLGEDPQFKARLSQLKEKEKTQQLNDQEKQEKEQLEQFTDLRSKKQKIFDMAGSGVGQILGLGSISAFTGGLSSARTGLGALKSLVAPSGGRGGIMAASYLMSHENNAKEALRMFPNEKDALKRFFSTEFNTAIDMAVEQIFPEEQFLSGIAKKEVSKLITNLTAKNIASTLNDNAFKQLAKNIVGRSKKLLATPLQETAEEEIALSLKKTFEGIIAPDKSEGLTLKDVVETGEQAFWGSVLLGAPKGVLGYTNNKVPLTALWDAASSQDGYTKTKMTIERLKRDGELTEAEAKDRLDNLELGRNEYLNNPILSGDMGGLDAGQKQNYFARILNEAILKKQADAVTDPNLKKQYEQQIKESEAIREKIYKGEIKVTPENEELTKQEFEKKEKEQVKIDQDRVLGDEEVELTPEQKIIQQAIDNNEVEGMFLDMAKAAVADPQQAKQLLDEAKSQATGQVAGELGSARSGVEKAWGKTIADFVAPIQKEKIVTGSLLEHPLYHGTTSTEDFDKFTLDRFGETDKGYLGKGVYLTRSKDVANKIGKGGRKVISIKSNIKKPFIFKSSVDAGEKAFHDELKNIGYDGDFSSESITDFLKEKGYDSVIPVSPMIPLLDKDFKPARDKNGDWIQIPYEEADTYQKINMGSREINVFEPENVIIDKPQEPAPQPKAGSGGVGGEVVSYEDAIKITPTSELSNPEQYGTDELGREAKTQALRDEEKTPPKFTKFVIGTYAKDRFGDLYQLQNVPIDKIVLPEGEQKRKETVDKYKEWYKGGSEFPPAKGVENYAVYDGKIVINDGHHRVVSAKQLGLKEVPIWVSLTDPKNPARPIQDIDYHKKIINEKRKIKTSEELLRGVQELGVGEKSTPENRITPKKDVHEKSKFTETGKSEKREQPSIINQELDLIGNEKDAWMMTLDEFWDKTKYSGSQIITLDKRGNPKRVTIKEKRSPSGSSLSYDGAEYKSLSDELSKNIIPLAIKNGKYQMAISDGRMTANDAKTIIESVGIEAPKYILEKAKNEKHTQETTPVSEPTIPPTTQAKELADKGVGKYEKKAREIADKIQKSELPDWLKADLPDGTKKAGASYDQLKKALADAVIEMGRLLDNGVEYSQAIKQAVKDLVSLQGEENRDTIEKGFEKYYTDQTQQQPPPPQTPKQEPKEVGGDMGGKKKAVLNRLYNAKNVPQSAKEGFEREGLIYKPKSQKEAAEIAKSVVDEFGVDEAVELADSSSMFEGDVRTLIFAEALDRLQGEENAARWAEVAIAMDKFERSSGRAASAVNYFYKNNPYGVQLKEEADRKEAFDKWATSKKEKSWKEFFEEFKKEPEFQQYFKEQVYEELKKERAKSRQGRIKKVRDIFAKAKASVSGKGAVYSAIIPPKIITGALDVMEKAYEALEDVVEVVQRGIDYINKEFGTSWDSEKFREEWEDKLKEPTKAPLTEEEFKKKVLDRFRNRLKGLSDKQRDEVVRRMFDKVVNAGALEYDDLRDIIADVLGYGKLTAEEGKRLQELVKKRNAVGEAAKKAQEERTDKALEEYRLSEIEAGKAARELQELLWNKPDIIKRLTSIMQLSTLGIPSLINNPVYNFFNQLGVRFPVGLINSTIDKVGQFVANKMGKNYVREYNIFDGQAEFWAKLGVGSKEAVQQLFTGLNRQDYIQKEYYGQQIRPMRAIRDLIRWKAGEKKLTKAQVIDKALQASVGIPAEVVARFLNIGDKPQRFAAEGSQAAAFAKALGLKDIDRKLFIEFPKEEAYRAYKAQGLSDEAVATKSEYIKEAIIKEGQRSTFQQDNLLNDMITGAFGRLGGKDSGLANLTKSLVVSPYIKIPTNAFWSYYNLVNPEVAILQSFYHAGRAKMSSNKGDEVAAKLQMREARYWLAHALTGMAMRGLVVFLVQAGIFVAGNTGDESKKEREAESFFEQPGTLNISKLWALMRGQDPKKVKNGVLVSNRWFGQFGTLGNSIMRKWEDMTPEQRENQQQFWNIAFGGMELEALKEMENGIFANTSSLLDVVNTGDFSRYGLNTINMFTNILQPASIAQINRASLNEVPQAKGDTFLEKLNQNFAQRSSLYRKAFDVQLQKKRSIWGEPMPKGGNILSRMFGITKIDEKKEGRPMYEDYMRTNDIGFLPPAVLQTMGKQKLNQEQYNKLQDYIGQSRKAIALPYIDDKAVIPVIGKKYSELNDKDGKPNDELRKAVLQYLYELGRDNGVAKFYQDYPEFKKPEKSVEEQVQESLLQSALELIKLQNR